MKLDALLKLIPHMLSSTGMTLAIFSLTLVLSVPLGFAVCSARMSRHTVVRKVTGAYLLVMRGTPLILQLIFFYFAPFYIFGATLPRFWATILAFVLNYAAYFCEIYRGGIESIPIGQTEAAAVLGFTPVQCFFRIKLPQVMKRVLPPMGSECMTLVKDTALAQVIGVAELFRIAQTSVSREASILPIFVAGIFYLIMNGIVARCFSLAEKKLSYYN